MSLETRIPKEINDYREKIVFGLSTRQLAAVGVAVAVVGLTAFFLYYLMGIDLKVLEYVLILEAMPIIAVGFIRHKGLDFEDLARIWYHHRFGPKHLSYQTDVDFLTSLYPVNPQSKRGVGSHEASKKELRQRRKAQKEHLPEVGAGKAPRRRRRSRASRHKQREKA